MKTVMIALLLVLAACSKGNDYTPDTVTAINSVWVSTNGKVLDLSQLKLNEEQSASLVIQCDGNYGNNGKVNGMQLGNVELAGTESAGVLIFGHLQYVGASNSECRDYSKEVYQYQINADRSMTLCMKNYTFCSTFVKQ